MFSRGIDTYVWRARCFWTGIAQALHGQKSSFVKAGEMKFTIGKYAIDLAVVIAALGNCLAGCCGLCLQ